MDYREAKVSLAFPDLTDEERGQFCHEFANLSYIATHLNGAAVVHSDKVEAMWAMAYFIGWKWRPDLLIEVGKKRANPEPEFRAFVHDMCVRLNLVKYDPDNEENKKAFEKAMEGKMSFTRSTDGKYAFKAQSAYESWCAALSPGKPYVEQPGT